MLNFSSNLVTESFVAQHREKKLQFTSKPKALIELSMENVYITF